VALAEDSDILKTEELVAILREVRERVRAGYPRGQVSGVPLADLMPLLHARDAAQAKVAAIGTVNPRSAGFLNRMIQSIKKATARALDWHIREQVEFNRNVMQCVESTLEALNEMNRSLAKLGEIRQYAQELGDMQSHWAQWRQDWERKLEQNEIRMLRSIADLQGAFQHRTLQLESNFRELASLQQKHYEGALVHSGAEVKAAFVQSGAEIRNDLERMRLELERMIHGELRLVRLAP
jgi:O-antigen chain-terminating methyltransferase